MNILAELENFIKEFNLNNDENFEIDSIRVQFQKQYKLERLKSIGVWKKINSKDTKILSKLKKRMNADEITTAYKLERENIYYYNSSKPPKYRDATLVIFGLKQYHKNPPSRDLITKILSILKNVSNIDICLDIPYRPNIEALQRFFTLKQCVLDGGVITDTYYINRPEINMIEKIIIYNKALKNSLLGTLWRIEAKVLIPNFTILALPLQELKEVTDIAKGLQ